MNTYTFQCEVQEPLILFKKSKTEQTTESLDYIPGNTFRGIVAAKLFGNKVPDDQINDIIFNGKVQFGDAHLLVNGERTLQVPASLYANSKDKQQTKNFHFMNPENWETKHKQVREGYLVKTNEGYQLAKVRLGDRMKATRNAETRSSEDGGLFLYRYIEKGQFFEFEVRSESKPCLEKIKEILHDKEFLFGKSKSAEFGGQIKINYKDTPTPPNKQAKDKITYLYAESNLCFLNEFGEFTAKPTPKQLTGNPSAEIDWHKSQLRFRTFYPYNGHRQTWDFERLIIEKGSVFVFKEPIEIAETFVSNGIGCFITEGFGKVLLNPQFFDAHSFSLPTANVSISGTNNNLGTTSNTLTFLEAKHKNLANDIELHNKATEYIQKKTFSSGITSSQWSQVYNASIQADSTDDLRHRLFNDKDGICSSGSRCKWTDSDQKILTDFLNEQGNKQLQAVKILAKKMRFLKKHKETKNTESHHEFSI